MSGLLLSGRGRVLIGYSEEDLRDSLEKAIEEFPDTCAVLVRRHGV